MPSLPFVLKVPTRDSVTPVGFATTTFKFRGLLRAAEEGLHLAWTGTARVEKFGFTGIGDETLTLPDEELVLPYGRLREIRLEGSWVLPRLLLVGNDLDGLRMVPGEDGGRLSLWLARRDRQDAAALVEQVRALL